MYRDEGEAARARADALEQEQQELKAKIEEQDLRLKKQAIELAQAKAGRLEAESQRLKAKLQEQQEQYKKQAAELSAIKSSPLAETASSAYNPKSQENPSPWILLPIVVLVVAGVLEKLGFVPSGEGFGIIGLLGGLFAFGVFGWLVHVWKKIN